MLSDEAYPRFEIIFGGHDAFRDPLVIDAETFIAVKGFKAKGKRITTYGVETVNELEPLRHAIPDPIENNEEVGSEESGSSANDDDDSDDDVLDEITGQMKLF